MTIENLKQIAIKYASTKGSRIPLAPDELCNAVVQYMNSFFSVMTDINTIKVAVTEDSGNIVFAITGNTYDGKPITPIVITVDHNDFVTDQEFEEFKTNILDSIDSLNNSITEINNTIKNINDTLENNTTDITGLKNRVDNTETNIAEINSTLENKVDVIKNPVSNFVAYAHINQKDENVSFTESAIGNTLVYRRASDGGFNVSKGTSGQNVANMENIADVEAKIPSTNNFLLKDKVNYIVYENFGIKDNNGYTLLAKCTTSEGLCVGSNSRATQINSSTRPSVSIANTNVEQMAFLSDIPDTSGFATTAQLQEVENKIPSTTNLADVTKENTFTDVNHFTQYITSFGVEIGTGNADDDEYDVSIQESGIEIFHYISGSKANSLQITENQIMTIVYPSNEYNIFDFPNKSGTLALTSDIPTIPEYTSVDSVIYDATNGAIIAYNGANEIHIPLLAGENVTIDASEDNKKIVISAAGGGGTGDVTAAGNNTFTGENTFNNSIYAKNGVVAGDTTNYGANSVTKGSNTYSFPNKSGTFAMTTDVIDNPIYFISFYANEPSEPCHLIGTMMSKNSYGTGQKTNEEFAVMLADNLYVNSNEGLAAYGRLAEKDILCIYSEDGLSIRCLNEENNEVDLPTVMFFVMET